MDKYVKQLRAQLAKLEDEITERKAIQNDRSLTWQKSRSAAVYKKETSKLVEFMANLKEIITTAEYISNE